MLNGLVALNLLLEGTMLESGERFLRYNQGMNEIQYSDDKKEWKQSIITVNEVLKHNNWNVAD